MSRQANIISRLEDLIENVLYVYDDVSDVVRRIIVRIRPPKTVEVERGDRRGAVRYMQRGQRYYNEKLYTRAHRNFRKAVRADESYGLAHYYLGLASYKLDLPDEARAHWTRATEVEPGSEAAEKARAKLDAPKLSRMKPIKGDGDELEE